MSYSIWKGYSGMNISKIGKTSLNAYSYDMMSQKTTYRFQLSKMQVYNEVEEEVAAKSSNQLHISIHCPPEVHRPYQSFRFVSDLL